MLKFDNEINNLKFKTIKYTGDNLNEEFNTLKIVQERIQKLENICEKKDIALKVIIEELNDKKFKAIELEDKLNKKTKFLNQALDCMDKLNLQIEEIYRFNSENKDEIVKFKINHVCKITKDILNKTKIINYDNP